MSANRDSKEVKKSTNVLIACDSASTDTTVNPFQIMSVLASLTLDPDSSLIVLSYCDLYLQTHALFIFRSTPHIELQTKLQNSARMKLDEFKNHVLTADKDEKQQYKAVAMLQKDPHLATEYLPFEMSDGSTVLMTLLQKTVYSLDGGFRSAVLKMMHLTGYSEEEIRRQLQHHADEYHAGRRPLVVDMSRWIPAYRYINELVNKKEFWHANQKVVEHIGSAQEDMLKQAPELFSSLFCVDVNAMRPGLGKKFFIVRGINPHGVTAKAAMIEQFDQPDHVVHRSALRNFIHRDTSNWENALKDYDAVNSHVATQKAIVYALFRDYKIKVGAQLVAEFGGARFLHYQFPNGGNTLVTDSEFELPREAWHHYYVQSMTKYDFPYINLKTAGEIFKNEEQLKQLVSALEAENNLQKHISFFRSFFRNYPDRLAVMLLNFKPNNMMKVLELIRMDTHLYNPTSELHTQANRIQAILPKNAVNFACFVKHTEEIAAALKHFFGKEKHILPIPYSVLLKHAKKNRPHEQCIFQLSLPFYFNEKDCKSVSSEEKMDHRLAFITAHQNRLARLNKEEKMLAEPLLDGKLDPKSAIHIRPCSGLIEQIHDPQLLLACALQKNTAYQAVKFNQPEKLLQLDKDEVNKSHDDCDPVFLLHLAALLNRIECAKVLLTRGADINLMDFSNGYTPLHAAAASGNVDMARLLIEWGADVNAYSAEQEIPLTPLGVAVRHNDLAMVSLICHAGAYLGGDNANDSLLHAADNRYDVVFKFLINAVPDPRTKLAWCFQKANSLRSKQLILATELEYELKKIPDCKAADEFGRLFSSGETAKQTALNILLQILNGNNLKEDLARHKVSLSAIADKEPWRHICLEAQKIADQLGLVASKLIR